MSKMRETQLFNFIKNKKGYIVKIAMTIAKINFQRKNGL